MSTALYRRYRPDSFETLIGQDHVTVPLRAALKAGKVTHAYLFSGPRGCGKTTSARIFARCLNCAQGPTDTPCGTCDSCVELATGGPGSLDVVEIDAASHGGVDDARELRERATFAPVRDRFKIFIIDEAHMVSSQGFNALLKLVEEPPEHVKFVFATTEPDKVLGTIRSRTHHYPFRLVPPDVLEPYLARLAAQEHIDIAPGVLNLVIRAGGGSVRDTLSVLDQLMAGAVDGALPYAQAVALLGYTDVALLDESVDALAGGDGAAVYRVVERMVDAGHDPRRFVEDLLQRLRDLLIISVAGQGAADVLGSVPSDQMERMVVQARNWGPRALSRAADLTDQALRAMVGATSPRLQLELLIGRILVPEPAVSSGAGAGVGAAGPLSGAVGLPGGGAPLEASGGGAGVAGGSGAALQGDVSLQGGGRFGAAQAREQLRRQRGEEPAEKTKDENVPGEKAPQGDASQASVEQPAQTVPVQWDPVPTVPVSPAPTVPSTVPQPVTAPAQNEPAQTPPLQPSPASPSPAPTVDAAPKGGAVASSNGGVQTPGQPSGADADMLRQRWSEVIERLSSISRVAWTLLKENGQLGGIDGGRAVVLFPVQGMVDTFNRGGRCADVERAIYEATGVQLSVSAQVGQATGGAAVTTASAMASQPFRAEQSQPVTQTVVPQAEDEPAPVSAVADGSAWPDPVPAGGGETQPVSLTDPEPVAVFPSAPTWPQPAPVPDQSEPSVTVALPSSPESSEPEWPAPALAGSTQPAEPAEASTPVAAEAPQMWSMSPAIQPWGDAPETSVTVEVPGEAVGVGTSVAQGDSVSDEAPVVQDASAGEDPGYVSAADDDSASLDDEDADVTIVSGLEAVQQILGAKVIEEKTEESAW